MRGYMPPFPNTLSWRGAQLKSKGVKIIDNVLVYMNGVNQKDRHCKFHLNANRGVCRY